jgi:hypothetical protein
MKDQELERLLIQLTEQERNLLIDGINLTAARIILKLFPDNTYIQDLVNIKSNNFNY